MELPFSGIWIFAGMVFAAVFMLSQGLFVPVFGENNQIRKKLQERLDDIDRQSGDEGIQRLLRAEYLRQLSPLEARIESMPIMESIHSVILQAGHRYLAYRLVLLSALVAIAAGVATFLFSRYIWAGLIVAVMAGALPFLKVQRDRAQRFARFEEQLPDAIDVMRRAMKAGHPFSATLKMVADDMDEPIAREFDLTFADLNYGNDAKRAMLGLLSRVPSVTVMALVTAVLVQRETGGNLAEILNQIADVIRGRFRLYRKVRTLSAEGRMSAWVLAMVPLVLVATLTVSNPGYLPMMIDHEFGQKLIMFTFVWSIIGIYFIKRIINIDV